MGRFEHQAQFSQILENYHAYLGDAANLFGYSIAGLKASVEPSSVLADVRDMAHKIKGNAAMYGYPELGLKAKVVEDLAKLGLNETKPGEIISALTELVDSIHEIRFNAGRSDQGMVRPTLVPLEKSEDQTSQDISVFTRRKNILLVYRNPVLSELLKSLLEPEFNVLQSETAEYARLLLSGYHPDLAIIEEALPDTSGSDLFQEIKGLKHGTPFPVFLTFKDPTPEKIAAAISLGVDGFCENISDNFTTAALVRDYLSQSAQRVLIVDDDQAVRELLKHNLESEGFIVDTAEDGIQALDYLSTKSPDLIILDHFMPRLGGGTVLYEIQKNINLKSTPVLVLTAMVNRGEAQSWFQRGATDFIPKPFDPEEVSSRVKQHLYARRR